MYVPIESKQNSFSREKNIFAGNYFQNQCHVELFDQVRRPRTPTRIQDLLFDVYSDLLV